MSIVDEIMQNYNDRVPRARLKQPVNNEEPFITKGELEGRLIRQQVSTIAKELGCSAETIQHYRRKYGLEKVHIKNH